MRDDRELMKLEGAEAISQLQELANLLKNQIQPAEKPTTVRQEDLSLNRAP
jgi:hypothetical protein